MRVTAIRGAAIAFALSLCALAVGERFVLAQNPSPSAHLSLESAKQHMDRGQQLYLQQHYQEAAEEFSLAYQLQPYAAFLYNEALCRQKLHDYPHAIDLFQKYLSADPAAPDAQATRQRIRRLQDELAAASAGHDAGDGSSPEAGAAAQPDASSAEPASSEPDEMKSLVLVESEPSEAPVVIYVRKLPSAAPFEYGKPNPDWEKVAQGKTPLSTSLPVGRYHIVMEPFADFHHSETDIDVAAGHVHQFKANLRQGEFLAFLRVSCAVQGARVYIDDPPPHKRPPWGRTPHEGLIGLGDHKVWVVRQGYEPQMRSFTVTHGEHHEELVALQRISRGTLSFEGNAGHIQVEIDGRPVGVVRPDQPLQAELSSGTHQLTARADGRKTLQSSIEVPRGQTQPVDLVLMPSPPRGAAWTQAAVAAAFIGSGTFLGLRANDTYDQLKTDRSAGILSSDDDRYTKGKLYAISSTACFGVGGVLAALSAYNFIRDPSPPSGMRLGRLSDYPDRDTDSAAPASDRTSRITPVRDVPTRSAQALTPRFTFEAQSDQHFGGLFFGGTF